MIDGPGDAILNLQGSLRNYDARLRDVRPISDNLRIGGNGRSLRLAVDRKCEQGKR